MFVYVCQKLWIFLGIFCENIFFGELYSEECFIVVVSVCRLEKIIGILLNGNMMLIGNGFRFKLIFSQWECLNLVCVVYFLVLIILLDNFFSYVDILMVNEIFDECIKGFLGFCLCFVVMC